jgi:3-oxoacyl-[acyl-carrier-protein] synthase III
MFLTLFSNKVLETMVDTNDEWITTEQELKKEGFSKTRIKEHLISNTSCSRFIAKY